MLAVTTGRLGNSCNAHGEASRKYVPGFQQGIGSYGDPTGDPSTGGPNGGSQQGVPTKGLNDLGGQQCPRSTTARPSPATRRRIPLPPMPSSPTVSCSVGPDTRAGGGRPHR